MMTEPPAERAQRAAIAPDRRLRAVAGLVLGFLLLATPPAPAGTIATSDEVAGVVELFTSQGCSSCPPADKVLTALARRPDVVALSYHVDYWDYIGWRDAFASRENTDRQRAYGQALGGHSVYTPQMIVNGTGVLAQVDTSNAQAALSGRTGETGQVRLELDERKLRVFAGAPAVPARDGAEPVLVLVTYRGDSVTDVSRGENEGQKLVNSHSVRHFRVLGSLAERPLEVEMPVSMLAEPDGARTGCAAFIQMMGEDGQPGAILAAAKIDLVR